MTLLLDFEKSYGPIDKSVILALEQAWGFRLPENYRNFLINYNGGRPKKTSFNFKNKKEGSLISNFFGINNDRYSNILYYYYVIYHDRIPKNFFPIASEQCGNLILISVKNPDRGKIYFWDHELEADPVQGEVPDYSNLTLIADSFDEFINNLKSEDEIET